MITGVYYEYSPTEKFQPEGTCSPRIDGSSEEDDDGVMSDVSAGGRQFSTQIRDPAVIWRDSWLLSAADLAAWRAFKNITLGRAFDRVVLNDGVPTATEVKLIEYSRKWAIVRRNDVGLVYQGEIVVREVTT